MSRTYSHSPSKLLIDEDYNFLPTISRKEFYSHFNTKSKVISRQTRRTIRHSLIDEEDIDLTNAICKYKKMSYLASDKNW